MGESETTEQMNGLPQPRVWTEPQECGFYDLRQLLSDASAAGFDAIQMTVQPHGYKVTFQRRVVLYEK